MKSLLRATLLVLLCIFGLAAFAPEPTKGIFLISGVLDCCKTVGTESFCMENGCWFVSDCDHDSDCQL